MPRHRYLIYSSSCMHNAMLGVFVLFAALMVSATANAKFKSFDLPDGQSETDPYSINNNGDIAGYYWSSKDSTSHAFVRLADGTITTFEARGSGNTDTYASSINDGGAVTGTYIDQEGLPHGFVRKPSGKIIEFNAGGYETYAMSINAKGWVTGFYAYEGLLTHGFLRAPDGTVTTLGLNAQYPAPLSINDKRRVTGWYPPPNGGVTGFLISYDGKTKLITCPNAYVTYPQSVNDEDFVAGYCGGAIENGFIRRSDGTITVFHPPGAIFTQALSINSAGDITGWYSKGVVNDPAVYGFVRFADGKIKTFSVRGAGRNQGTYAQAINNSGIITGFYFDSQERCHGFVGTP